MKKLLLLVAFAALSGSAFAACHTVSIAGSGSHSGADWNNEMAGLPSTLIRGDIYYLADGVGYANYTFSEAGSTATEVRKAQSYDNCTSTGWNTSTMGSAQAVFNGTPHQLQALSPGLIFNGNGRQTTAGCGGAVGSNPALSPATPSDCGIKFDNSGCSSSCTDVISDDNVLSGGYTLEYVEMLGMGNATAEGFMVRADSSTGTVLNHIYMHYFGSVCVVVGTTSFFTMENSYFFRNQIVAGGNPNHGQCLQSGGDSGNMLISGNVFRDLGGTSIIMSWVGSGTVEAGPYTYIDNVIWTTPGFTPLFPSANGLIACINGFTCNGVTLAQNTIGLMGSAEVGIDAENGGNFTTKNEVYYQSTGGANLISGPAPTLDETNNSYLVSGSSCPTGTANVCNNSAANPFNNSAAGDFTLAADSSNVNNRTTGGAIPTTDAAGNLFTTDRGAYQFVTVTPAATAPSAPSFAWMQKDPLNLLSLWAGQ